jgi:L-2-hydroxyglutarate oxidase LhgO
MNGRMAETLTVEVVIVGAGIVGLACASECGHAGYTTLLVEQHRSFGQETSSRNSEVIHSGIYYPTGSLKAELCVRGNRTTYKDCERFGVWHRVCGKLIVAVTPEEEGELETLFARSKANGVSGITMMTQQQAKRYEQHIRCSAALYLTTTGIVDSHQLMSAYARDAEQAGATILFGTNFLGAEKTGDGYRVRLREADGTESEVNADRLVNAGGLHAIEVAQSVGLDTDRCKYKMYPNRGHYFRIPMGKSALISHLVYPVPPKHFAGLGIHMTLDKAGQVKLGPDTEYIDPALPADMWYTFDESRKETFHKAVARYFPALTLSDLTPDQVGVRPKIQGPGAPMQDFIIANEKKHGYPGLIDLIGIESPGLTCAREIGKKVVEMLT